MILAGDIGGTKVNLGLFEFRGKALQMVRENKFASRRYASLAELVLEFLADGASKQIESACFGIAGPVRNGKVHVTNLPWEIEATDLAAKLKIKSVSLLNDLEANGYGLAELSASDFCVLNKGEDGANGNAAIIAAGTGLGEAGLYWDGRRHHPFACEGGHADFGPLTKLDSELFDYLCGRFGRVSCERVLSGVGLFHIYEFLRDTKRGDEPAFLAAQLQEGDPAAVIVQSAASGESTRCARAVDMFISYYGAEAGNLGLKMMATGGVYIGGGIAPKLLPMLKQGGFMSAFLDKDPMRPLLEAMPVRVVLNPETALLGAAHFAAHGAESISSPAG